MPKIPFRDRQEVQADVLRLAIDRKPVSDITNFLQEKYGKAYRKQNLLEDIRRYQQRELDLAKAAKAVPRKYRKEDDRREHLLIYMVDKRGTIRESSNIRLGGGGAGVVKSEISQLRNIYQKEQEQATPKRIYFEVYMVVGGRQELEIKLELLREVNNIQYWSIIPTEDSARVLHTISKFTANMESTQPWLGTLQQAGRDSRTLSFQKLVRKVLE